MADSGVTGVLLVGGASTRFRSPKALALFRGEMLAVRAERVLQEAFGSVIVVGKAQDALPLPFPVLDDASEERAAIVGVAAALRLAQTDLCVVLPTDMPYVTAELLRSLAAAADGKDAALVQTGPLPGAYRRSVLPVLEAAIGAGHLGLQDALASLDLRVLQARDDELTNVNTPADLAP
ncbi:MAG TPA: molybdenum cofactor guanylyltransferase [Gaiellaceae bacterium]